MSGSGVRRWRDTFSQSVSQGRCRRVNERARERGSTVESPFQSRFPKRWRREEAGSRKGRASGWGSSEQEKLRLTVTLARFSDDGDCSPVASVDAKVGTLVTSTFTSYYWTTDRSPRKILPRVEQMESKYRYLRDRITASLQIRNLSTHFLGKSCVVKASIGPAVVLEGRFPTLLMASP